MKRAILCVFMTAILCACTSPEKLEEDFSAWSDGVETVSLTAVVTISQDDSAAEFELACSYSPEEVSVEILSPENLKGITASMSDGDAQLEYDDLVLGLGEMEGISPANAPQILLDTIRTGYIDQCYIEKNDGAQLMAVQFAPEDGVTLRLWLDENMVPQAAELESAGSAGIKIAIKNWNIGQ